MPFAQNDRPLRNFQTEILPQFFNPAAVRVLLVSMAMVIGPTPPGTGVTAAARSNLSAKATSPTSFVFGLIEGSWAATPMRLTASLGCGNRRLRFHSRRLSVMDLVAEHHFRKGRPALGQWKFFVLRKRAKLVRQHGIQRIGHVAERRRSVGACSRGCVVVTIYRLFRCLGLIVPASAPRRRAPSL